MKKYIKSPGLLEKQPKNCLHVNLTKIKENGRKIQLFQNWPKKRKRRWTHGKKKAGLLMVLFMNTRREPGKKCEGGLGCVKPITNVEEYSKSTRSSGQGAEQDFEVHRPDKLAKNQIEWRSYYRQNRSPLYMERPL